MITINFPGKKKLEEKVTYKATENGEKTMKSNLTSYEFEKAAKNALIEVLEKERHLTGIEISDLQLVWFSYTLGLMKCLIYSPKMFEYYAEVTYNKGLMEMYVDVYEKVSNTRFKLEDFNYEVL